MTGMRELARRYVPVQVRRSWRRLTGQSFTPPPGAVRFGDLRRTTPIASDFGYSRGGPVDRYYIESLPRPASPATSGVACSRSATPPTPHRFGGAHGSRRPTSCTSTPRRPERRSSAISPTGHSCPTHAFDCVVLTQTLHLVYDFAAALRTLARVLAPGGVLLMTVPGISNVDAAEWGSTWHYSFTRQSVQRMCAATFAGFETEVTSFGNVLAAVAFLHGLGRDELSRQELDDFRPRVRPHPRGSCREAAAALTELNGSRHARRDPVGETSATDIVGVQSGDQHLVLPQSHPSPGGGDRVRDSRRPARWPTTSGEVAPYG